MTTLPIRSGRAWVWGDGLVPVPVEGVAGDRHCGQLVVADLEAYSPKGWWEPGYLPAAAVPTPCWSTLTVLWQTATSRPVTIQP
jgi:hypothetical protein